MLESIPTEDHLARMYDELARRGAACVGERRPWPYRPEGIEELVALGADMARHDPRLFDILVAFFDQRWKEINPCALRALYGRMRTPQAIAVMAEFLLRRAPCPEEKKRYLEYLQAGLIALPLQFFYHHLYPLGGHLMQRATEGTLREYKRWGFLAREAPVLDEERRETSGSLDGSSRRNVLLRLLRDRKKIRLAEYRAALPRPVSRQQALLDLRAIPGVRLRGRGRGARWELVS